MKSLKDYLNDVSKFNFKIDNRYIIKVSNRSRYTKDIANNALNDVIIPFPNFEPFNFINENSWNTKNKKYGNSYQLYIHTLRFVNELLLMYEETREQKYMKKAKTYIMDWIDFVTNYKTTALVWYDHSVAQRVQVLLFYLLLNENDSFENELIGDLLNYHAEFMLDIKNYKHNNHSLMMDRSLMLIGLLLKNDRYFDTGYYRSIDTFWRSFSKQGLHLENSPDYHNMVIKMYVEMETILNKFDKSYGDLVNKLLIKAQNLSAQIALHNHTFPTIGDTNNDVRIDKKSYENLVDYESGLSILQNKDVYLGFISGYSTVTHKHHDDLSVMVMFKGEMIFEDGGKYNYSSDNIRKYMLSVNAHSNIHVNNENYPLNNENILIGTVKIVNNFSNEVYSLVKGQNLSYENVELYRTVIFIESENTIIIIDDIYAQEKVKITHNFNLHQDISVEKYDTDSILSTANLSLQFKEFTTGEKLEIINNRNSSENIVNSTGLNKKSETNQLRLNEEVHGSTQKLFVLSEHNKEIQASISNKILDLQINQNYYTINF